ncbi:MAG: hypothetical protein JWP01_3394 [Myxococcales bacterium]|nr:hypothetical protein [Myxococcales bacterium]
MSLFPTAVGARYAGLATVRVLLLVMTLSAGCFSSSMRPAVIGKMSELPPEAQKRDAILDSAVAQPGPEQRQPLASPRARKVETAAATAAAILGHMFSKTENVTFGGATTFDENQILQPTQQRPPGEREAEAKAKAKQDAADAGPLVPWVRIGAPPSP